MHDFLAFLRTHKAWWIPPIAIFFALLAWLAWKAAGAPDSPFDYRNS